MPYADPPSKPPHPPPGPPLRPLDSEASAGLIDSNLEKSQDSSVVNQEWNGSNYVAVQTNAVIGNDESSTSMVLWYGMALVLFFTLGCGVFLIKQPCMKRALVHPRRVFTKGHRGGRSTQRQESLTESSWSNLQCAGVDAASRRAWNSTNLPSKEHKEAMQLQRANTRKLSLDDSDSQQQDFRDDRTSNQQLSRDAPARQMTARARPEPAAAEDGGAPNGMRASMSRLKNKLKLTNFLAELAMRRSSTPCYGGPTSRPTADVDTHTDTEQLPQAQRLPSPRVAAMAREVVERVQTEAKEAHQTLAEERKSHADEVLPMPNPNPNPNLNSPLVRTDAYAGVSSLNQLLWRAASRAGRMTQVGVLRAEIEELRGRLSSSGGRRVSAARATHSVGLEPSLLQRVQTRGERAPIVPQLDLSLTLPPPPSFSHALHDERVDLSHSYPLPLRHSSSHDATHRVSTGAPTTGRIYSIHV